MTFNIIRPATEEDTARFEAAKTRFEARYGFDPEMARPGEDVWVAGEYIDTSAPLRNWRKAARRALRHPLAESIAYGYVGHN